MRVVLPIDKKNRLGLRVGDECFLSGRLYTARDMAHKRLTDMIKAKVELPIGLTDEVIYYCGPTPPPPGKVIGSCGPTTSNRMDAFTEPLLKLGLGGIIGKGRRSEQVRKAIKKHKAVYFIATGGAGALLSRHIKKMSIVAFREFGTEAIHELVVEDFPVIVAIDSKGEDIYSPR